MYKVTFSYKGYVAGVQYVNAKSEKEAISLASCVNKYSKVRAELVK